MEENKEVKCGNCGDGSGWHFDPNMVNIKTRVRGVWGACADCNDDGKKPKPELCECHGLTKQDCENLVKVEYLTQGVSLKKAKAGFG